MEHLRIKGKIESINGPLMTIRCFDYQPGAVLTNEYGQNIGKREAYSEIDICPTGAELIGRKVRIIA